MPQQRHRQQVKATNLRRVRQPFHSNSRAVGPWSDTSAAETPIRRGTVVVLARPRVRLQQRQPTCREVLRRGSRSRLVVDKGRSKRRRRWAVLAVSRGIQSTRMAVLRTKPPLLRTLRQQGNKIRSSSRVLHRRRAVPETGKRRVTCLGQCPPQICPWEVWCRVLALRECRCIPLREPARRSLRACHSRTCRCVVYSESKAETYPAW